MPESQHPTLHLNEREQIQYLLGNAPSWMLRYGITAVAALFVFLLALSYFIHYPDIVEVKVTLTTVTPPIRVVSNASGRISELLAKDGQAASLAKQYCLLLMWAKWKTVTGLLFA